MWTKVADVAGTEKMNHSEPHKEKRIGGRSAVQNRMKGDLKLSVPRRWSGLSRAALGVGESRMASLEIGYA